MPIADPFARKDHRLQRWLAVGWVAFVAAVGASSGWRHAAPMLALGAGGLVHVAFAETPPRPSGQRVVGAILLRRSLRRILHRAMGALAVLGVLLVEQAFGERAARGGRVSPLLLPGLVLALLAFGAGLWQGLRAQIRVTPRGLERRPAWWGSAVKLSWPDVEEIRGDHALVLRGRGAKITVDPSCDGISDFAAAVLASAPPAAIDARPADKVRDWLAYVAGRLSGARAPMVRE